MQVGGREERHHNRPVHQVEQPGRVLREVFLRPAQLLLCQRAQEALDLGGVSLAVVSLLVFFDVCPVARLYLWFIITIYEVCHASLFPANGQKSRRPCGEQVDIKSWTVYQHLFDCLCIGEPEMRSCEIGRLSLTVL